MFIPSLRSIPHSLSSNVLKPQRRDRRMNERKNKPIPIVLQAKNNTAGLTVFDFFLAVYWIIQYITLRPRQKGCRFPDDIFKCIFLNENVWISIKISLNFVPKGPINNIPSLVQIMAWCRPGDKPLSEPMMVSLLTHICVTRLQWDIWLNMVYLYFWKTSIWHHPYNIPTYMHFLCNCHQVSECHGTSLMISQHWFR